MSDTRAKLALFGCAAAAAIVLLTIFGSRMLFPTYRVTTGAMAPTILAGEYVLTKRVTDAARGDLVTFRPPTDPATVFVKRVVAVGGDLVEIRAKQLFVNGQPFTEPYVRHEDPVVYARLAGLPEPYRSRDNFGPHRVPFDHFFMLGDNRDRSYDCRYYGDIPRADLRGRVVLASSRRGFRRPR